MNRADNFLAINRSKYDMKDQKENLNIRILLADDDNNFGYVMKKELEEHDFTVDIVNDGVEAILNFVEMDYGFILLDIKMPRLNGMDTLKIMKTLKISKAINPQVQVIIFSGENDDYREEALRAGAVRYISKPFNIEALTRCILSLIELTA